ncbi:UNVERIFIED_CONTAM: hypothetical protein K2H54_007219 [Gekko kuhli]
MPRVHFLPQRHSLRSLPLIPFQAGLEAEPVELLPEGETNPGTAPLQAPQAAREGAGVRCAPFPEARTVPACPQRSQPARRKLGPWIRQVEREPPAMSPPTALLAAGLCFFFLQRRDWAIN